MVTGARRRLETKGKELGMKDAPRVAATFAGLIALVACALFAPAPARASSCPGADALPLSVSPQSFEGSLLCLLNQQRTSHGLVVLHSNSRLQAAALGHSTSMRIGGYFEHVDPNGATVTSRVIASGYTRGARRWRVGENLAWGEAELGTPEALVSSWIHSATHSGILLTRQFRAVGIGVDWGSPFDPSGAAATITADFGFVKRRKPR
jgi:uncharacterized protein YkwD